MSNDTTQTKPMFQKMYVEEPDKWEEISEEDARHYISSYFKDVDAVIDEIKSGTTVRTPWAFYRFVEKEG